MLRVQAAVLTAILLMSPGACKDTGAPDIGDISGLVTGGGEGMPGVTVTISVPIPDRVQPITPVPSSS